MSFLGKVCISMIKYLPISKLGKDNLFWIVDFEMVYETVFVMNISI